MLLRNVFRPLETASMHQNFSKAVDPIFVAAIALERRIENHESIVTADERATLISKFDAAERELGRSEAWKLSKFALCCWIDSKLIENPWAEHKWWINNCLEAKFFGSRVAHEEFFRKSLEASALPEKDALEVFYLAVVLGFRGFYGNNDVSYSRQVAERLRIPETLEGWCRETSRSLQVRPKDSVPGVILVGGTAKPLSGRRLLGLYAMMSLLFVAIAIACFIFLFDPLS